MGGDRAVVCGEMAGGRGLTVLAAGVKKRVDNNGGRSGKRSHGAAQGQVHKGTQEVEERSRWRWSPRRFGGHRNQTGSFPLRGPATHPAGPFPVRTSALTGPSCSVSGLDLG
jgi:hypothetical protein